MSPFVSVFMVAAGGVPAGVWVTLPMLMRGARGRLKSRAALPVDGMMRRLTAGLLEGMAWVTLPTSTCWVWGRPRRMSRLPVGPLMLFCTVGSSVALRPATRTLSMTWARGSVNLRSTSPAVSVNALTAGSSVGSPATVALAVKRAVRGSSNVSLRSPV